jgi:starch phosphorylase
MFLFGLEADEVAERRRAVSEGQAAITPSPALQDVLAMIEDGVFSPGEPDRFAMLTEQLRGDDRYMVVADFYTYWQAQRRVDALWRNPGLWARACLRNIAAMGWFSADRAIEQYAKSVWRAEF